MRYVLLALFCFAPALAQPGNVPDVYVGVEVLPSRTTVGDPVLYRAHVTIQDNVTDSVSVVAPDFTGFTLLGEPEQESRPAAGSVTEVLTYRLRPNQEGSLTIAPFTAQYQELDGGAQRIVRSSTVRVTVDSRDLRADIRPNRAPDELVDPTLLFRRILAGLAVGCALVLAILLITGWLAKQRSKPAPIVAPPRVPAHFAALRRLKDLRAENLPERGLRDTYHVRLAGIIRDYVAEQYGVASQESTSSETLLALFRRNLPPPLLSEVKELLSRCDGVKFAEQEPDVEAMEALIDDAVEFVEASSQTLPGPAGETVA